MQTFLPYSNFTKSAVVLDPKRLGNQAYRECITILRGGWENHPASKMWTYHFYALCDYTLALLNELDHRGLHYPHIRAEVRKIQRTQPNTGLPYWIGNEKFHSSHRAALLAKDYGWYSQFGWTETPKIDYVWPDVPNSPNIREVTSST